MSQREDRKRFIVSGALRADGLMPAPYVEEAKELGAASAEFDHGFVLVCHLHFSVGVSANSTRGRAASFRSREPSQLTMNLSFSTMPAFSSTSAKP